jgi:hypothetical protein
VDAFTIALGHEIEETVTDPGTEDIVGNLLTTGLKETNLGGWYDPLDADENGDKCAYVGTTPIGGLLGVPTVLKIPGALHDLTGNRGETFAVQSLWSNQALGGLGYCAGQVAGTSDRCLELAQAASLAADEGRSRRLSQRWQIVAGQPAHRIP